MKKTLLIIAALMLTACDKDEAPQPVDTPTPVVTATPTVVAPAKGNAWCPKMVNGAREHAHSPCANLEQQASSLPCDLGKEGPGIIEKDPRYVSGGICYTLVCKEKCE